MRTWEYNLVKLPPDADTVAELNSMGALGWELVGITVDSGGITFLYLKKEITP